MCQGAGAAIVAPRHCLVYQRKGSAVDLELQIRVLNQQVQNLRDLGRRRRARTENGSALRY